MAKLINVMAKDDDKIKYVNEKEMIRTRRVKAYIYQISYS